MNPILNYSIQFILGGLIVAGMSILAKYFHPKYAALLYAIPIQFTLAAIFIYYGTKAGTIQQLAHSSIFFVIGLAGFIFTFYLLTKYLNFWPSLAASYVLLAGIMFLILKIV